MATRDAPYNTHEVRRQVAVAGQRVIVHRKPGQDALGTNQKVACVLAVTDARETGAVHLRGAGCYASCGHAGTSRPPLPRCLLCSLGAERAASVCLWPAGFRSTSRPSTAPARCPCSTQCQHWGTCVCTVVEYGISPYVTSVSHLVLVY